MVALRPGERPVVTVEGLSARTSSPVVGRPTRQGGQAEAARRILDAAGPLFYGQGIRAVSADAVIDAAGVTKTTFYRHFPTKDDLVVAYLSAVSAAEQRAVADWRAAYAGRPVEVLRIYARTLGEEACGAGFRGCPFLNAVAEYPDDAHPVHVAVERHRTWLRGAAREVLEQMGVEDPDLTAVELVMVRDGAMAAGRGVPATRVTAALLRAGTAIVRAASPGA
ncbi:TetR/AcrR family transcriptional regulator [Pengzhenrongella frigida]|uniref:TetR/AcrR family transcriptional regulator n=1 Tax=Pengzhenrongella frigida TaxID=1259133 RepID=A0A4V1ZHJ7_9MICO|nr:TetR/AcrR family transcriptional regulator [Cellulomonas sp. HLT2-17]RYV52284.1 TetR/AcrR family transcriptional regulator [Cellulomonas sp. HLT2-17]